MDDLLLKYYKILGVQEGATQKEIEKAYNDLIKNPDLQHGGWESLKEINLAYESLKNYLSASQEKTKAKQQTAPHYQQPEPPQRKPSGLAIDGWTGSKRDNYITLATIVMIILVSISNWIGNRISNTNTNENRYVEYLNIGNKLLAERDYSSAITAYNQAIQINSKDPIPHNNLGIAYERLGDRNKAYENYQISAALGGKDAQINLQRVLQRENQLKNPWDEQQRRMADEQQRRMVDDLFRRDEPDLQPKINMDTRSSSDFLPKVGKYRWEVE